MQSNTNIGNNSNPVIDIPAALTKGSLSVTPAPASMGIQSAHSKSNRNSSTTLIRFLLF